MKDTAITALRAVCHDDVGALLALAHQAGAGMTTLKPDEKALAARVDVAVRSQSGELPAERADFMFVLDDQANRADRNRVAGVSALKAAVGLDEPFYNFRLGRRVHCSRELGIYADKRTLFLTNDYTGCAELCTLYLDPACRGGSRGRLLSKARLMYAANRLDRLPGTIIAELRGYQRDDGTSPFWDSLGRHFFRMEFDRADDISSLGSKSFIAELMPRYPVYTDFLTEEARAAIGVVHRSTAPARRLLEEEGFWYESYVDIFDAGPVLQAHTHQLRMVRDSALAIARRASPAQPEGAYAAQALLVANTLDREFRAIVATGSPRYGQLALSAQQLDALHIGDGDPVRVATLNPGDKLHA
jgi:arginine N-succinyltransferase